MNNIVHFNQNTENLVTLLSDFRDIEDTLIWVLEKMREYEEPEMEQRLKDLVIDMNHLKNSKMLPSNHRGKK